MSALSTAPPPAKRRKKKPILAGIFVGGIVVLIVGFIVARAFIESYLHSDRFRKFVERKTGDTLRAQVNLQPFQFTGSSIYAEGLTAQGSDASAFAALQINQARIDVSARRFFEHVWQVDQVDVQHLRLSFDGPRVDLPPAPAPVPGEEHPDSGFLPNRVEIGSATVHSTDLQWSGGELTGSYLDIIQREGGWNIAARGGQIRHSSLPELDVESAKLRYREPSLFIESADLRQSQGGTISASGEVHFGEHLDLRAKLNGISVTPLLPDDWRVRLTGNLTGNVHIESPLPSASFPKIDGAVDSLDGHLEALPVLDQIALFTGSSQFRHLALSKSAGKFQYDGNRLSVSEFVMEAARLIRIEGDFVVENGQIDGNFQVGVTPPSLQWLPGAQDRVFTTSRNGYLWTPMHLAGPVGNPKEDLTGRLAVAAQGAVIDQATQAVKPLQDAAHGLLDDAQKKLNQFLSH